MLNQNDEVVRGALKMRLLHKRVLITGGARGIGQGIAERFGQEGAKLFLLDRNEADLERTVQSLRSQGIEAESCICDLGAKEELARAADLAWGRWDGIDVLVNNAGIAVREPFIEISDDHWDSILNVNLNAVFRLSRAVAGRMVERNIAGSIVNMASKNALAGSSMLAHYNSSKGGVRLLTESMAVELAPYGIRVNAVAPGFIDTPLDRELKQKSNQELVLTSRTPMGRLGTVEEVANVFLFLASDEASYVTGTTVTVDGGHLANASEL